MSEAKKSKKKEYRELLSRAREQAKRNSTVRNLKYKKKDASTAVATEGNRELRLAVYEQIYRSGEKKMRIDIRFYILMQDEWKATIRGVRFDIENAEAVGKRLLRLAASWKRGKEKKAEE